MRSDRVAGAVPGLPAAANGLRQLGKSGLKKVACAVIVKRRTAVPNKRLAQRFDMMLGASMSKHAGYLGRGDADRRMRGGKDA